MRRNNYRAPRQESAAKKQAKRYPKSYDRCGRQSNQAEGGIL